MAEKFHERFKIQVPIDEVKRRFVSRVDNEIFRSGPWTTLSNELRRAIATELGDQWQGHKPAEEYTRNDFLRTLQAIEGIFNRFISRVSSYAPKFEGAVNELVQMAEVDLGVSWQNGRFYPTGAKELDEELINKSLDWLQCPSYLTIRQPFDKALNHLLRARANPDLLSDVITDAYEAAEALAKVITGNDNKLDANQELFLTKVRASEGYKRIMKEYIAFAHKFRHAAAAPERKPKLSYAEAESFVYLTGVFLRLAISATVAAEAPAGS